MTLTQVKGHQTFAPLASDDCATVSSKSGLLAISYSCLRNVERKKERKKKKKEKKNTRETEHSRAMHGYVRIGNSYFFTLKLNRMLGNSHVFITLSTTKMIYLEGISNEKSGLQFFVCLS